MFQTTGKENDGLDLKTEAGGAGAAGITINGGGAGAGGGISVDVQRSAIKIPPQTAYGMTVSSTADSGGGMPDVGAFAHEKVYTVYLDMRANTAAQAPSWTFDRSSTDPTGARKSRRALTILS